MHYEKKEVVSIQAMRGFAALTVVIYHYSWFVSPLNETFLHNGYFGVDLFFIISGFLVYVTTKRLQGGGKDAINYIVRRFSRIAPLYYIVTASYLVYFCASGRIDGGLLLNALKSALFIPLAGGKTPAYGFSLVESGWTLNYEFFFI